MRTKARWIEKQWWKVLWMAGMLISLATPAQQKATAASSVPALDYYHIQQLYARYCHVLDSGANNGYLFADVFTPDGTLADESGKVTAGREKLAELARSNPKKGPTNVAHYTVDVLLETVPGGNGKAYSGKAYVLIATAGENAKIPGAVTDGGVFWDDLVETAGDWRIKNRVFHRATPIVTAEATHAH
jgi:hypothetical protein